MTRLTRSRDLYWGAASRAKITHPLQILLQTLGPSLGPNGRTILFGTGNLTTSKQTGLARVRALTSDTEADSMVLRLFRETLIDAERTIGDGTTRVALMAAHLIKDSIKLIEAGAHPGTLAKTLHQLHLQLPSLFEEHVLQEVDFHKIAASAKLPAQFIPPLCAAFEKADSLQELEIQPGQEPGCIVTENEGYVFDCTRLDRDRSPATTIKELIDCYILVVDDVITDFGPLLPILEGFAAKRKSLVIIARDILGTALTTINANADAGNLSIIALKPKEAGPGAAEILEDLAAATGADLIADRLGRNLNALKPDMLGFAGKLTLTTTRALFSTPKPNALAIETRRAEIEAILKRSTYLAYDRENALRRLARLDGKWVEFCIAGTTKEETAHLLALSRRAYAAMRSAQQTGSLQGGGIAPKTVAAGLMAPGDTSLEIAATALFANALRAPALWLAQNRASTTPNNNDAIDPAQNVEDPLGLNLQIIACALSLATTLLSAEVIIS